MPLIPPRRLPWHFNRRITSYTKALVRQHHYRPEKHPSFYWHRLRRRSRTIVHDFRWFGWYACLCGIPTVLLVLLVIALFSPWVEVQEITVARRDSRIDIEQVQQALSPLFGRKMPFLSRRDLLPLLLPILPELRDVTFSNAYPSQLVVRLQLQPLFGRVLVEDPENTIVPVSGSGTFATDFITTEGMFLAYGQGRVRNADTLPLLTIRDWGVRPSPGSHIIDTESLVALTQAEKSLEEEFGQRVQYRAVYVRAQEFHLSIGTAALWFDARSPIKEQMYRYQLFLQTVPLEKVRTYIDLRLADRVVYH